MPRSANPQIASGLNKYSRAAQYKRSGRWAIKNKKKTEKEAPKDAALKTKKFGKGERTIQPKGPKFYFEEDSHRPLKSTRHKHNAPGLRSSITPGTVLILVAGKYRGRRVVFLRQMESGLLLVTGPYKINGVPLRRVHQRYVIATSTKIDVSKVEVPEAVNDKYFAKHKSASKRSSSDFLAKKKSAKKSIPSSRKEDQKKVDTQVIEAVKGTPQLKGYLAHNFTLRNGQYPHDMKF